MQKYIMILIIILIILNLLLSIPVELRIVKRNGNPLLLKARIFNFEIYSKYLKKNKEKSGIKFKFKAAYLFENNLNEILSSLKDENFFVYLILEYAKLTKVTVISTFNSENPTIMPYVASMNWFLLANIKKYIDYTFKVVKDDYYQIVLLQEDLQGINFEIYSQVTLLGVLIAIIKRFKIFLKLFKRKEKINYE